MNVTFLLSTSMLMKKRMVRFLIVWWWWNGCKIMIKFVDSLLLAYIVVMVVLHRFIHSFSHLCSFTFSLSLSFDPIQTTKKHSSPFKPSLAVIFLSLHSLFSIVFLVLQAALKCFQYSWPTEKCVQNSSSCITWTLWQKEEEEKEEDLEWE